MSQRCPSAIPVRPFGLFGWKLVFRGTADIEQAFGHTVIGAFYSITQADASALDRYEGVGHGTYQREYLRVHGMEFLTYIMNSDLAEKPPLPEYLALIEQGYLDWRLPTRSLASALE